MADITYDEWMDLTKKSWKLRSGSLKDVDKAFKAYEDATGPGAKSTALQELSRKFRVWVGTKGGSDLGLGNAIHSIRNRKTDDSGQGPVERLQSLIRGVKLSNVAIVRDLQAEVPDRLVMDSTLNTDLKTRFKVRETYDRAARAVDLGRTAALKASTAGTAERTLYERWFGAYDATRAQAVRRNLKGLCDLFNSGVIIVHDARTLVGAWGDCFGFAMPGDKKNYVEFTVGRAFFDKKGWAKVPGQTLQERNEAVQLALASAYSETSDWTVGTMIHELGHAANSLPDVDFQAPSSYQVSPGGLTPMGWTQCSTPALDQALALADPDLAVVNTDSYGQFCREALQNAGA
jgi:hypothetical protein